VENGVETYSSKAPGSTSTSASASTSAPAPVAAAAIAPPPPAQPVKEEEDDLSLPVPEGARCKRLACGATWAGEEVSRGDGEEAKCRYHPQAVSACQPSSEEPGDT
jgi:hypothetical protein